MKNAELDKAVKPLIEHYGSNWQALLGDVLDAYMRNLPKDLKCPMCSWPQHSPGRCRMYHWSKAPINIEIRA